MIQLEKISKYFNNHFWEKPFRVLNDVSFNIKEGSICGFLGSNGAGKTTSIKIIMGFISSTTGDVKFNNKLGTNRSKIYSNIGYLPERPFFYPYLTGREFISFMGMLNEVSKFDIQSRAKYWTERLQIGHALDRKLKGYSKGMLQRLGFVTSLIHNPMFLILDEPLSGLDPIGRKEMKDVLVDLNNKGTTIFFSSHIVSDVEEVCNEVIFLQDGKMHFHGDVKELVSKYERDIYIIKVEKGALIETDICKRISKESENKYEEYQVEGLHKNNFLRLIIDQKKEIIEVKQDKSSLEQIFYKMRKEN